MYLVYATRFALVLNKMAGKTSRCESIYSSFEQLKEFKIDVKKGISESLKKTKHFALRIFSLQHITLHFTFFLYFAKRNNHDRSSHFVNLNKFD